MDNDNTPANARPDAKTYNAEGNVLLNEGKLDEAIEKYKKAIAADAKFYIAHYNWGLALAKQHMSGPAIEKFKETIRLNHNYAPAYHSWGLALEEQDKQDEAIEKYREAIRVNDKYADAYNSWGLALEKQEKPNEAIEKYRQAIVIDDQFYLAYYNWGRILAGQKKYDEAIAKYTETILLNDKYANAYDGWGLALAEQQKHDEAIEKFKQAIAADANFYVSYYNWGVSLANQKKYDEAIAKYKEAVRLNDKDAYAYDGWGLALAEQKKYDEAIEKFELAIAWDQKNWRAYRSLALSLASKRQYAAAIEKYKQASDIILANPSSEGRLWNAYNRHNLAELIWRQGRYKDSRKEWDEAKHAYLRAKEEAVKAKNADFFNYYGSILQSVLDESEEAEGIYKQGLELDPNHVDTLTSLVGLYIEKKDSQPQKRVFKFAADGEESQPTSNYWAAREHFVRAKAVLEARLQQPGSDDSFLQLGQLFLALGSYGTTEEYESAEKALLTAFEKNKESANVCASLGVLYARAENYQKAVQYLSDAVRLEPDDLTIRSSLAEAHLKAGATERAELEYRKVLAVTHNHVESHIGLGEVYKAMGDADDDADMYFRAIQEFTEGMRIAGKEQERSRKLTGKNFSAACYSRGYARVKLYEASKAARDESLLNKARADFGRARDNDSENYKAARALEKIGKRFGFRAAQRLIEKLGPWVLFSLSFGVFAVAQISIYKGKPIASLDAGYYALLTFGSLLWMVASISLPQLLKLKVAGIELEKSAVEQITTSPTLEISR